MARPLKQTVDYFPHDTAAGNGRTLYIVQSKYGNDGYAFWFKLLELLGRSEGHVYDYNNPADWEYLLAKTNVSEDTANSILQTLIDLDAIDVELAKSKVIWCQHFVDNIADAYSRRQADLPVRPSNNLKPKKNTTPADGPHGAVTNEQYQEDYHNSEDYEEDKEGSKIPPPPDD